MGYITIIRKYVLLILTFTIVVANAQESKQSEVVSHDHLIKLNLLPIFPAINGHNQKWAGLEYNWLHSKTLSLDIMLNAGLFEDYTFIKYHNYFEEDGGFCNTRQEVRTWGYHIIPSIRYHFLNIGKIKGRGFYLGGNIDFNQYIKTIRTIESLTGEESSYNCSSIRFSMGATLGGQYILWSRIVVDVNISLYAKLFAINSDGNNNEIDPLHATWLFYNGDAWSTLNVMIGYSFGTGKRRK